MSFVKDQKIDLLYLQKPVEKALVQDLSRTDQYHVFLEMGVPGLLVPVVYAHAAVEQPNALIDVIP